jgi:hypothetical protein
VPWAMCSTFLLEVVNDDIAHERCLAGEALSWELTAETQASDCVTPVPGRPTSCTCRGMASCHLLEVRDGWPRGQRLPASEPHLLTGLHNSSTTVSTPVTTIYRYGEGTGGTPFCAHTSGTTGWTRRRTGVTPAGGSRNGGAARARQQGHLVVLSECSRRSLASTCPRNAPTSSMHAVQPAHRWTGGSAGTPLPLGLPRRCASSGYRGWGRGALARASARGSGAVFCWEQDASPPRI